MINVKARKMDILPLKKNLNLWKFEEGENPEKIVFFSWSKQNSFILLGELKPFSKVSMD